jgi:predicted ATPase/class 3 adenylate cyclase
VADDVADLPTGTVTFLFTDLEGSTRLWEDKPEAMKAALARHDDLLREAVESCGGHVVKTTGDGVLAVFATAHEALNAAVRGQRSLGLEAWTETGPLRVRMGLHTGEAENRSRDYYGAALNRAARLMSAAHAGQIVVSNATEQFVRADLAPELDLIDLGEHRFRDLSRPVRVFQVTAPGLRREFPKLRSLDEFLGNLPRQVTSFIGRGEELKSVVASLDEHRLVTLTGPGGIGKTRLSIQVAAELQPRYADGAWICELAGASDGESLLQLVAATLGVQPRADVSLEGSIVGFLATKQLLLILDNCEHLILAAARLVGAILRDAFDVRILATSREALGVTGERSSALGTLPLPDPTGDYEAIAERAAVRLFTERAAAVREGFVLEPRNAATVAELCCRLDGIPLAIELAAARVVAMSPAEILARLDERFRLLIGGERAGAERHQTLAAAVDWSYSLLETPDRLVFARLGVFVGGFDLAAAEAVVAAEGIERSDVLDAVASLVARSMVVAEEHDDATTRYRMLETLRDYALERLDDVHPWKRRHAQHYATFAEQAGRDVTSPDEVRWRRRIRSELDNLRAAVSWALARDESDAGLAIRIVAALARESYLDRSAGIGAWAERAVSRTSGVAAGLRYAVLAAAAQEALGRDDLKTARSFAVDAVREGFPPDCPAPACGHIALAMVDAYCSEVEEALRLITDAADAMDVAGGDLYCRTSLHTRLALLQTWNLKPAARAQAEEAVGLARRLGNPSALADALYAFSWAAWSDDPDVALAALDECIALTRAGASDSVFDGALAQAARLRAANDESDAALDLLREAVVHSYQIGYRRAVHFALSCGVEVLLHFGYAEPAAVISGYGPARMTRTTPPRVLRAALDPDAYERAATRGGAMTFDEIVTFTVTQLDQIRGDVGR